MISNTVTAFRLVLTIPLFLSLMLHGPSWIAVGLFLTAGGLDMLDGKLARSLGEVSRFGAMLDLIGDRMLTFAAVAGLLAAQALSPLAACFAVIFVVRDIFIAALAEGAKEKTIKPSRIEPVKVGFAFAGLSLAMLPKEAYPEFLPAHSATTLALLGIAAALTLVTMVEYSRQTLNALLSDN